MALRPLLRISVGHFGSRRIFVPGAPTMVAIARTGVAAHDLFSVPATALLRSKLSIKISAHSESGSPVSTDPSSTVTETRSVKSSKRKVAPAKKRIAKKSASLKSVWSNVESWVVFSDLHFSRRTSNTCLQVLQAVHAEASLRDGGIIFLGDFWHARGALPVELLNVVVKELATWGCPAIFIPGNHDQVTMSGHMHALMVLGAVNPLIKVFDEPVQFLGALWLPFRRDHNLIKQALDQHRDVNAIFAHLDVVGACMNEAFQAKDGIEPTVFPQNIPIYTGHYHKPHVVKNTHIEYIGSPYQVSAGEIGQSKRFLLLNNSWQKIGEIPIDKGARHYILSDVHHIRADQVEHLRSGDRLRLVLSSALVEKSITPEVERLRSIGIDVSLDTPLLLSKPRIEQAENLDVLGLFNLYAERVNMGPGARLKGVEILENMDLPAKLLNKRQVRLVFKQVEITGFGPYLESVAYPLYERGIRVICGKNRESPGADSNGAGKSTLVMAPLWALSGSTDPRPDSMRGLLSNEVIHENAKTARVRVDGEVNGRPFTVERSAGRKPSLSFSFDGEDWTGQDIKLTQAKIDDMIDTTMLRRVAFHGQYGIGGLLEASDKDFKEELSKVIALDVWMEAKKKALQDLRAKQAEASGLEGSLSQLRQQRDHMLAKVHESESRRHEWDGAKNVKCTQLVEQRDAATEELGALLETCRTTYQSAYTDLLDLERLIAEANQVLVQEMQVWHGSGNVNENAAVDRSTRDDLVEKASKLAVEVRNVENTLKQKRGMLSNYSKNVSGRAVCDKCLQTIDHEHILQSLSQLEKNFATSEEEYAVICHEEAETREKLEVLTEETFEQERRITRERMEHKQNFIALQENVNSARESVSVAYSVVGIARNFLGTTRPWVQASTRVDLDQTNVLRSSNRKSVDSLHDGLEIFKIDRDQEILQVCHQLEADVQVAQKSHFRVEELSQLHDGLLRNCNPYISECNALQSVLEKLQQNLEETIARYDDAQAHSAWLKELDTAFSHTGVQSYVLEEALTQLQESTARFLDILSGGNLKLMLRPTKDGKRSKTSVEMIDRVTFVRLSNGQTEQRSLRQLSGGERRRQALALALGFTEFATQRSGLHCDLLVLDEVLQHLDSEGKARVVALLRELPQSTILLVSQTQGDVADAFDLVDVVVKQFGTARVESTEALY